MTDLGLSPGVHRGADLGVVLCGEGKGGQEEVVGIGYDEDEWRRGESKSWGTELAGVALRDEV